MHVKIERISRSQAALRAPLRKASSTRNSARWTTRPRTPREAFAGGTRGVPAAEQIVDDDGDLFTLLESVRVDFDLGLTNMRSNT